MKLYNKLLCLGLMIFAVSCGNEYDRDENFDLEELPGYVAFFADGGNINVAPLDLNEDDSSVDVIVHSPVEILSDVTVTYSLGGTAVLGTDYTIEGTTGTMVISADRGLFAETYRGNITINSIGNDVFEGNKTIELTLTGASNAEGEIAIGRGGKDFQRVAIVNIIDSECESEYAGTYKSVSTIDSIIMDGMLVDTMITTDTALVVISKLAGEYFSYNVSDASSGAYAALLMGSELSYDITEDCGVISAADQEDEFGETVKLTSGGVSDTGVISLTLKRVIGDNETFANWTTTLIPN